MTGKNSAVFAMVVYASDNTPPTIITMPPIMIENGKNMG
jgi:hypothetical protein